MRYVPRHIAPLLLKASKAFPALIVTGPRRAGKTTLLRKLFPKASYILIEDPDIIDRIRSDPRSFIQECKLPVILDEIQNVPEILNYIRSEIDRAPRKKGQWFITGSQEAPLMKGVSESMAGRAAIFQLYPFSCGESRKTSLLKGGYPDVLARPSVSSIWYASYLQTYLERDVRAISSIKDLATFRRFISLLASRSGQILNRTNLAGPLGVSIPTVTEWLNILEITSQIILVPPFFENFGKRLIKSPKLYFVDSGLACYLLHIESESTLNRSPFLGPLFEGYVASEISKSQINSGKRKEIYYFRDQQGLEVDFLIPAGHRRLLVIEAKASRTMSPKMGRPLHRLRESISNYKVQGLLVHRPSKREVPAPSIGSHVKAITVSDLSKEVRGPLS